MWQFQVKKDIQEVKKMCKILHCTFSVVKNQMGVTFAYSWFLFF